MLVLRLLVMLLTIICLMDGHAEVLSSTTRIRNRGDIPDVKPNEPEVELFDRKKKKPNKAKKNNKKKKPKPKKPKPSKKVTTTLPLTTSTLKTTTITTTTTTTSTTAPPTTTTIITTSTAPTTTTVSITTSATISTIATSTSITTKSTISTTSSLPTTTATTADSGDGGECKATNGKPCIFPFKDGNNEYNECKNHGGKYVWCATAVYDSGKYKYWSYCPKDGSCPIEDEEECRGTNNKPCVFPFKDGKNEYNECADFAGKYFWCATGTNSAGQYTAWSQCPKDGSCPLAEKSTPPAMTSPTTTASTAPLTTGTTAEAGEMEEKVLDTLQNLVLGESRDGSLQMAQMLNKELDSIIKDLEGETRKSEQSNFGHIATVSGKLNLTVRIDQVAPGGNSLNVKEVGEGFMFDLSTVNSMKSVKRESQDCCSDCRKKYRDTELAEYWKKLDTCYCYTKMKKSDGTLMEPETWASSEFSTEKCSCRKATIFDCPSDSHTFITGGFRSVPEDKILDRYNVNTPCDCRQQCDNRIPVCKSFLFSTCSQDAESRCLLLTVNEPETFEKYMEHYAFCRRDTPNKKNVIHTRPKECTSLIPGAKRLLMDPTTAAFIQAAKNTPFVTHTLEIFSSKPQVLNTFMTNNVPFPAHMPDIYTVALRRVDASNIPKIAAFQDRLDRARENSVSDWSKKVCDPLDLEKIDPRSGLKEYINWMYQVAKTEKPEMVFVASLACSWVWCIIGVDKHQVLGSPSGSGKCEVCDLVNFVYGEKRTIEDCSKALIKHINEHVNEEDVPRALEVFHKALEFEKQHFSWIDLQTINNAAVNLN